MLQFTLAGLSTPFLKQGASVQRACTHSRFEVTLNGTTKSEAISLKWTCASPLTRSSFAKGMRRERVEPSKSVAYTSLETILQQRRRLSMHDGPKRGNDEASSSKIANWGSCLTFFFLRKYSVIGLLCLWNDLRFYGFFWHDLQLHLLHKETLNFSPMYTC